MKVVVVGGGPAGFSAAMVARKAGADVTVIERTDMLGGLGLVAGIGFLGNYETALVQERALGGGDLLGIFESIATHKGISAPGYHSLVLYNVTRLDAAMQRALKESGIEFILSKKVSDIELRGNSIEAVILADSTKIQADTFVDASGTAGGVPACEKYGYGCVECIYRCPTFGNPGGLAEKKKDAKIYHLLGVDGKPGRIGTSVMVPIASLSEKIQRELSRKGYVTIPVPPDIEPDMVRYGRSGAATTSMMDQDVTKRSILLLDIGGFIKVTATGSPLYARSLRKFPGLEDSIIMQPLAGARGHLIIGVNLAWRDDTLKVDGFDNLFIGGWKAGESICLMDSIVTADLAGHNAVRQGLGKPCLTLPTSLAAGAYIDHTGKTMRAGQEVKRGYQGVAQIEFLKAMNVYHEGVGIAREVDKAGLRGVYQTKLC